jgi:hypothetical protein
MSPHIQYQLQQRVAENWENLDDTETESDYGDEAPLIVASSDDVDLELGVDKAENDIDDDQSFDLNEMENEESIRAFYQEFDTRPPPMRHFSFSENSNESSPLLNPLKRLPNGTSTKFRVHRLWRWYNQCLTRRPVVTKSVTAGVIVSLGDMVGQIMGIASSSSTAFDVVRLARFCSMGLFLQAPVTHYYYVALDHHLPPTPNNPWTPVTFFKLLIDQAIYAPAFLFMVFVYVGFLEGDAWTTIQQQLQQDYFTTLVDNCKLRYMVF